MGSADLSSADSAVVEVRTRLDDPVSADRLAQALVGARLAACAHVRGPLRSIYRWQGMVECTEEFEVDAVTAAERAGALVDRIRALHPYEVPAILVTGASATVEYAAWVAAQVSFRPGPLAGQP